MTKKKKSELEKFLKFVGSASDELAVRLADPRNLAYDTPASNANGYLASLIYERTRKRIASGDTAMLESLAAHFAPDYEYAWRDNAFECVAAAFHGALHGTVDPAYFKEIQRLGGALFAAHLDDVDPAMVIGHALQSGGVVKVNRKLTADHPEMAIAAKSRGRRSSLALRHRSRPKPAVRGRAPGVIDIDKASGQVANRTVSAT